VSQKGNAPATASEERASKETALRAYLGRILGWERTQAIEHALRSIELSITYRAALVLLGHTGIVSIALALHRRTLGADRPFVVGNPRHRPTFAMAHRPTSYTSGVAAVRAARGGTLCVRHSRRPVDFDRMAKMARALATDVQLVICSDVFQAMHPFLIRPVPIRVPPLTTRARELPRIVDAYARDALDALGADDACFTAADRTWVFDHAARTLLEIEMATLRLVALRQAGSAHGAAKRLGMSHVALSQWLNRRRAGGAS
jgi:hypothetical protein